MEGTNSGDPGQARSPEHHLSDPAAADLCPAGSVQWRGHGRWLAAPATYLSARYPMEGAETSRYQPAAVLFGPGLSMASAGRVVLRERLCCLLVRTKCVVCGLSSLTRRCLLLYPRYFGFDNFGQRRPVTNFSPVPSSLSPDTSTSSSFRKTALGMWQRCPVGLGIPWCRSAVLACRSVG